MTAPPSHFDFGAAEEAASQLLATSESILEVLAVLDQDRTVVTEDWSGRFRDTYDHEVSRILLTGEFLATMLQQQASLVRAEAWQARAAILAAEEDGP